MACGDLTRRVAEERVGKAGVIWRRAERRWPQSVLRAPLNGLPATWANGSQMTLSEEDRRKLRGNGIATVSHDPYPMVTIGKQLVAFQNHKAGMRAEKRQRARHMLERMENRTQTADCTNILMS